MHINTINRKISFELVEDKLLNVTKPTVQLTVNTASIKCIEDSPQNNSENNSLWNKGLKV